MEKHLRHLPKLKKGEYCLNCGHFLSEDDNFCPRCGQLNDTRRPTFMDWVREILGDFFAYDSRLINSIKPLLTQPGQLSIDYIKGKRASHIHPIRLYLIVSFVLFLFISLSNFKDKYILPEDQTEENIVDINGKKDISIYSIFTDLNIKDSLVKSAENKYRDRFAVYLLDLKKYNEKNYEKVSKRYPFKKDIVDKLIFNKAVEYAQFSFDKMGSILYQKTPLISLLFLPFFVIFLNLIHYKKDILYLEHLVFTFNTQSVLFILMIVSEILSLFYEPLGDIVESTFLIIIFPIYLFMALRNFYQYPNIKRTVLMFVLLNITYLSSAIFTFILGVFLTFFAY
jgi:hypothetical protein